MTYKVESGVPIPKLITNGVSKYPWGKMEIGDSFFVPNGLNRSISPLACEQAKRHNKKFSCRTVDGGVRVWRIA